MLGIKCVNGLGLLFAGSYICTRDIMTTVENLAQGAVPSKQRTDNSEVKFSKNSDSLHHYEPNMHCADSIATGVLEHFFCQTHKSFACSVKCLALE